MAPGPGTSIIECWGIRFCNDNKGYLEEGFYYQTTRIYISGSEWQ